MMLRRYALLALLITAAVVSFGQQRPLKDVSPRWTVLLDPVCPVSDFYQDRSPNATAELRVMYFPKAEAAKLKDPQSPELQIAFNYPRQNSSAVIPLSRKDDHWEAVIPLQERKAMYAIFSFKDGKTNQVDDNGGQFWDVVFCDPAGREDFNGVLRRAESYTGAGWPLGMHRTKNYDTAVAVLEKAIAADERRRIPVQELWKYKAERDGGDAQAWAKLSKEVAQFISDNANDRSALYQVGFFLEENSDKLPADFVEQTVTALDAKSSDPKYSVRAGIAYRRAVMERDPQKRLAALDEFLAKYPKAAQAAVAQGGRFSALVQLGDVAGAEAAFAKYREQATKTGLMDPNLHNDYIQLAELYIDKQVKLEEALKLIDEAKDSLANNKAFSGRDMPEGLRRFIDAQSAILRARAYVAMHKPGLALPEARKALGFRDDSATHFVLAQALAASGDKKAALDEYFEAALRPSNKDLEYATELRQFYISKRFGNARQFEAELQRRKSQRFEASKYVPQLVERDAPALDFITIKGEKFDKAALAGKTLVVNFWSPG